MCIYGFMDTMTVIVNKTSSPKHAKLTNLTSKTFQKVNAKHCVQSELSLSHCSLFCKTLHDCVQTKHILQQCPQFGEVIYTKKRFFTTLHV